MGNQTEEELQQLAAVFPAKFVWGAATASYQIEGAAHEDGRGLSIWDRFATIPGKVQRGETGDIATDHYHHMHEDVELMASLGLKAYRFSIAWPRILPEGRGTINTRGLDFYERLVDALLAKGISPFATLYHWDLPVALQDQGGWLERSTAYAFADYAEIVARRLGDRLSGWITQNEPWCAAFLGYGIGVHAPGLEDQQAAITAGHHLLLSHGLAIPRLRAASKAGTPIGITLNLSPIYAADDAAETRQAFENADAFSNRWFLDPLYRGSYPEELFRARGLAHPPIQAGDMEIIATPTDFLGVNYYSRTLVAGGPEQKEPTNKPTLPGAEYTDMGWEIFPQGLTNLLLRLHNEYHVPSLYVTENGAAFKDHLNGDSVVSDPQRLDYLYKHIKAIGKAVAQGAPVHGYFVWSLLDNFEWAEGYSKRFGIVYVDYPTQRRIVKDSGHWYTAFLKAFEQAHSR
ncbi:beta-glucosidase [Ktedonosporobacter rubrisoli]|uniref:Beta-glucosidase n=2 Tax=Ktedonosporobacter rubrisoli TaxID=2509675 RepID=A0A4P6K7M7_KTERU|nr:beta-glucosidase [Ktedonosporobacter rubrisoli]